MAETMTVEAAEAALAAARVDVETARKRWEEEFSHLRVLSAELAWSNVDDKSFAKKSATFEEARLKVDVLKTRIDLYQEKVEEARQTLEAAKEAADQSALLTTRQRFDELKQLLAEDGKQLEALVRQARVKLIDRVRAHRAVLEQANRLGQTIFEADQPEAPAYEYPEVRSRWALSDVSIKPGELCGEQLLLTKLECIVDDADQEIWRANRPPPPPDLNALAELRRAEQTAQEFLEREAEKEHRSVRRELGVTREELDAIQLDQEKQAAIDAKVARDNPERAFRADFPPEIG